MRPFSHIWDGNFAIHNHGIPKEISKNREGLSVLFHPKFQKLVLNLSDSNDPTTKDFVKNSASLHSGPGMFLGRADEHWRRLERLHAHLPQGKHVGKGRGTRRESESRRRLSTAAGGVASRSNYPLPCLPPPAATFVNIGSRHGSLQCGRHSTKCLC